MASGPDMEDKEFGFTITQEEFTRSAKMFAEKSDKLYDGWQIAERNGVIFLRLEKQIMENNVKNPVYEQTKETQEYKKSINLESCLNEESSGLCEVSNLISLEYHVIYSISYCVPVLYIRGFDSLGGVLRIDKLIKKGRFPNCYQGNANDLDANDLESVTELNDASDIRPHSLLDNNLVRPDTFSQTPHPLLFEPFYQLHPCHTSQWMKMMYSVKSTENDSTSQTQLSAENYIIIWLSFVGPYVGLSLDNKYMLI